MDEAAAELDVAVEVALLEEEEEEETAVAVELAVVGATVEVVVTVGRAETPTRLTKISLASQFLNENWFLTKTVSLRLPWQRAVHATNPLPFKVGRRSGQPLPSPESMRVRIDSTIVRTHTLQRQHQSNP